MLNCVIWGVLCSLKIFHFHFQPLQLILFAAVVQCISYMADQRIKIQHVGIQRSSTELSNEVRTFHSIQSLSGFSRQYEVKDAFYQLLYLLNTSFPQRRLPKKWFHCPLIHYTQQQCQLSCKWLKTQLQGHGKCGARFSSSEVEKGGVKKLLKLSDVFDMLCNVDQNY